MSKKTISLLSLSLLVLAACTAPADVTDDAALNDEVPPAEDVVIDDLILEEETDVTVEDGSQPADGEVLILDEEAVVDGDAAVEAEADVEVGE